MIAASLSTMVTTAVPGRHPPPARAQGDADAHRWLVLSGVLGSVVTFVGGQTDLLQYVGT